MFELSEEYKEGYEKGGLTIVNKNVKLFKGWFEDTLTLSNFRKSRKPVLSAYLAKSFF